MGFYNQNLRLFADDREVYQHYRVRRILGKVDRYSGPVIKSDMDWEKNRLINMWGSVVYNEEKKVFQAWYLSSNAGDDDPYDRYVMAYAESDDGIEWRKPELKLYKHKGSYCNNICIKMEGPSPISSVDGGAVLFDPDEENPDRRYKFIGFFNDHRAWAKHPVFKGTKFYDPDISDEIVQEARRLSTHYMVTSPDGIHWDIDGKIRLAKDPNVSWSGRDAFRLTRDERTGEYMLTSGANFDTGGVEGSLLFGVRYTALRRGRDIANMGEHIPFLVLDEEDGYGSFGQFHFTGLLFNYGNQYLGLLDYISDAGKREGIYLLSSRDGMYWDRIFRDQALIPPGSSGSWDEDITDPIRMPIPRRNWDFKWGFEGDKRTIVQITSVHNPPILKDDRLYFYYSARRVFSPELLEPIDYMHNTPVLMGIGMATLPRDRFVGLRSVAQEYGGEQGFVITAPVEVTGRRLYVNIGLDRPDGWAKVELKDGTFIKPSLDAIREYSLDDSLPISEDGVHMEVKWKDKSDINELEGKKVALKIVLHNATVYSYSFE